MRLVGPVRVTAAALMVSIDIGASEPTLYQNHRLAS
jgi:hypothetical protein